MTENKHESKFNIEIYEELYEKYGVSNSCYVFYENEDFKLSDFPDAYKQEFKTNIDLLKFGFHGLNYSNRKNIEKDINELERIIATEPIDNVIKLSKYLESKNEILFVLVF